jgi:arginyl-tRNA synthetase
MLSIQKQLKKSITNAARKLFHEIHAEVDISPTKSITFGHFQSTCCLRWAKELKKSPRDLALALLPLINEKISTIASAEIAGPGYINFTLSSELLSSLLNGCLSDERLGIAPTKEPKKIIVEFSSPNIAKELHVGHLRSTIIGECLARIFEFFKEDVLRLNHIGDWGTSFGMLIAFLKEHRKDILQEECTTNLGELVTLYKKAKELFDQDPHFKKRSQLEVVALQSGNQESLKIWELICAISRKEFEEIYQILDVKIQERGESYYNPVLQEMIHDLESKKLITISGGAKCIYLEGFINREGDPLPMIIQKSDGGFNYDTTDLAAMRQRVSEEKAARIIILTDAGQAQHFSMLKQAAIKACYLDPHKVRFDHVPFGLVLGPDGKKFRTRSGETEKLIDLLHTAVEKARTVIEERSTTLSDQEKEVFAKILGIGALKYSDLMCHRMSDYSFSYEKMLKFDGNTCAFLLYAYVRSLSILHKSSEKRGPIEITEPSEVALALQLLFFEECLEQVKEELAPHRLTDYLYGLCEKFHAFYRDCPVVHSTQERSRLALTELFSKTIKLGLNLLGIETVDKM